MTIPTALFFVLIVTAGIIGCISALASNARPLVRTTTIILRSLQVLILCIAFSQPVITCNRLVSSNRQVAILVDASESMSAFDLQPLIGRIDSLSRATTPRTGKPSRSMSWYLFGDSLRAWNPHTPYIPADGSSYFPILSEAVAPGNSAEMVLITDAMWSNGRAASAYLQSRAAWYLPLSPVRTTPFITSNLSDSLQIPADSSFTISLPVNGNVPSEGYLRCTVTPDGTLPVTDSALIAQGNFSHTFALQLPPLSAGFHRLAITFQFTKDTLVLVRRNTLVHSVPRSFSFVCSAAKPSLDIRFIRSALANDAGMHEAPASDNRSADAVISSGALPENLPEKAALIVLGKCSKRQQQFSLTPAFRYHATPGYHKNSFSSFDAATMPPVAAFRPDTSMKEIIPLFSCSNATDTTPLVFRCRIGSHPALVCALEDFWKWDFLPLARQSGESDNFAFTRRLLSTAHEMLFSMHTDTFFVLPAQQPVERGETPLWVVLPSTLLSRPGPLHYMVADSLGRTVVDTSVNLESYVMVSILPGVPPLPKGRYRLSASLENSPALSCQVNMTVDKNQSEKIVSGQNEALLGDVCRPLDLTASLQNLGMLPGGSTSGEVATAAQRFPLHRGWPLLVALLCALFAEWIIRKVNDLD